MSQNFDYLYNEEQAYCFEKNHFVDNRISYKELDFAVVLPPQKGMGIKGGVVDKDNTYVEDTGVNADTSEAYSTDDLKVIDDKRCVIYLGMFSDMWGHSITDSISRMWFFHSALYGRYEDYTCIYIAGENFKFHKNFLQLLSLLSISAESFVKVDSITRFRKVVIPDRSFFNLKNGLRYESYYTKEYIETIEMIKSYQANHFTHRDEFAKVFLSYCPKDVGKRFGIKQLEKYFEEHGYNVVRPEDYSFYDQLNIFANCKWFCSTIGSCSHNSIFLNADADVILIPRSYYVMSYQLAIDELVGYDVKYVDSTLSVFTHSRFPWGGPHCYIVSNNLYRLFGEKEREDFAYYRSVHRVFRRYVKYSMGYVDLEDRIAPEYYFKESMKYINEYYRRNILFKVMRKIRILFMK